MCGGGTIGSVLGGIAGGIVGGPPGAIIGSGLGSTAGGLASGESFGDALKGGAISAGTAGIGQALGIGELLGDAFNFSTAADPAFLAAGDVVGAHAAPGLAGLATAGAPAAAGAIGGAPEALGAAWGAGSPDLTQALDAFGGIGPDIAGAAVDTGFSSALPGAVATEALPAAVGSGGGVNDFLSSIGFGGGGTPQDFLSSIGFGDGGFDFAAAPTFAAPTLGASQATAIGAGGGGAPVSEGTLLGIESDIDKTLAAARSGLPPADGAPTTPTVQGLDQAAIASAQAEGLLDQSGNLANLPWVNPDTGAIGAPAAATVAGTAPAAAAGAAAVKPPTSFEKILSGIGLDPKSGVGQFVNENKNLLLPAGVLGYAALNQGPSAEQKALLKQAQSLGAQGQQLAGYLQSGTLPPGAQSGLDQAAASAKAAIRSQYSRMGLSGSTMERQALASVDERVKAQGFAYASQLLNAGIAESGISGQLYNYLISAGQKDDAALGAAIANFAGAAAGGAPKTAKA